MNLNDLFNEEKVRLDPKCWTGKKIGNPKTKMKGGVRVNNCVPAESIEENAGQPLSVQQLATISDAALDAAYGYGRSTPGNTFGWQANLKSAAYAKQMIDQGVTDIEAISDAIHKGWNTTAQTFVQDPEQFDDTAKLAAAGKLEAKLQQRAQLMKQNYGQLPEEEKEKDRVVARALLQAIRGEQGVAEGKADPTGSWVVYDGSKVKRFKSREGAKAYAAKNGGKVASSEFYADKIQKQGVAEGVMYGAENLNVGDDVIISGDVELNGATGVIDSFGQDKRFVVVDLYNHGRHSFHSSDVSANDYDSDEHDDDLAETRVGQVPMTLKPGETDNLEPEDFEGFKKLPAYKQGQQAQQSRGKDLIQQSPYTYQSDQDWAYRNGAFDARQAATSADFAKRGPLTTENTLDEKSVSQAQFRTMAGAAHNPEFARKVGISQDVAQEFNRADKKSNYKKLPARATEGEQQKGADYRDPKEVDYDAIDHDKSVARLKHLAGLGPMKTTYDPAKRQYRNMPTADQPKR
jgi:hypothetical protein